jgi:2-methylcitrate dehydratase PrpD
MTILHDAAEFARHTKLEDIPGSAIQVSKSAIIDFLGITLAGTREAVSVKIRDYAIQNSARKESRILGTHHLVVGELAALANGVAGHALDFDDTSWTTIGHPTVTVLPAVLAIGELVNASGCDIIRSYLLGVEIQHKIASLMMPETSEHGWHTTSVFGPLGAAAASALLFECDTQMMISALGIAASKAGGLRSNFGTMTKAYHAGMSAMNGVMATRLAQSGITASLSAIEAEDGFIQTFSGKRIDQAALNWGDPWDIIENGLVFKKYPCCSGTHPALDCLFEILNQETISDQLISSLEVGVSQLAFKELVSSDPGTPLEARFSMEFVLAVAIVVGKLSLEEFTIANIKNHRIQSMMSKVKMVLDPELAKLGFIGTAPAKLKIVLKNGRTLTNRCNLAKGNPEKPFNENEIEEKFINCTSKVLPENEVNKLLKNLSSLEAIKNINQITSVFQN